MVKYLYRIDIMKIVFTPSTGSSIAHVVRSLTIADELKKRGHKIYFTSNASKKDFIEHGGFKVVAITPSVNFNDPKDQSINYMKKNRTLFKKWLKSEIEITKKIKPDLVVAAGVILGPHIYYATKTPVIGILDAQYLEESYGLMGISLSKKNILHKTGRLLLRPIFNKKFINLYLSEVLWLYKELQIDARPRNRQELYSPMPVIIPSDEILEPLRKKRKNTIYSGPLFWKGFKTINTNLTENYILKFKGKSKLLYATFGGSIFDKKIYLAILQSLDKLKNIKKIICLGPNWERTDFPPDTDDMIIRKFVPGELLSKHADIILNTGSQGAVSQALKFGKVQITFPTTIDQSFYANRIQELELGININPINILKFSKRENYTKIPTDLTNRIITAIKKMQTNSKYQLNSLNYQKNILKYNNPEKIAANFIEKINDI